jgi:excinuclease ABC subunit B
VQSEYSTAQNIDKEQLRQLIDKAREDMERAAKSQDFLAAIRYRDKMYELQKLRDGRE